MYGLRCAMCDVWVPVVNRANVSLKYEVRITKYVYAVFDYRFWKASLLKCIWVLAWVLRNSYFVL